MAQGLIFVKAQGATELKALSRRLKDAGRGDLRREMRTEIRQAGKPVVSDLRAAVMRVDVSSTRGGHVHPDRSTGLRRQVAKATNLSVTQAGIRFRVSSKRLPFRNAAKYLDATLGNYARWRHPVFGNRAVWTEQKGEPWFGVTIRKHTRDFRRAVFHALKDTADKITD